MRFTRKDDKKLYIAINPSAEDRIIEVPAFSGIYVSQNCVINEKQLTMKAVSFIVAEIQA